MAPAVTGPLRFLRRSEADTVFRPDFIRPLATVQMIDTKHPVTDNSGGRAGRGGFRIVRAAADPTGKVAGRGRRQGKSDWPTRRRNGGYGGLRLADRAHKPVSQATQRREYHNYQEERETERHPEYMKDTVEPDIPPKQISSAFGQRRRVFKGGFAKLPINRCVKHRR